MEKQISRWSYFLGIAGVLAAIGWRILAMFGLVAKDLTSSSHSLTYDTVMQGAFALLVITIATGSYLSSKTQ